MVESLRTAKVAVLGATVVTPTRVLRTSEFTLPGLRFS
jgi:hypothetical protein